MLGFQFFGKMDATPIHVTCKFARRYGKDYESEVSCKSRFQNNKLDSLRMPSMISEMAVVLVNIYLKWEFTHISRRTGMLFCFQLCQITATGNLSLTLCRLWCLIPLMSKAISRIVFNAGYRKIRPTPFSILQMNIFYLF